MSTKSLCYQSFKLRTIQEAIKKSWNILSKFVGHIYNILTLISDILKVIFLRGQNFSIEILRRKEWKKSYWKPYNICEKWRRNYGRG